MENQQQTKKEKTGWFNTIKNFQLGVILLLLGGIGTTCHEYLNLNDYSDDDKLVIGKLKIENESKQKEILPVRVDYEIIQNTIYTNNAKISNLKFDIQILKGKILDADKRGEPVRENIDLLALKERELNGYINHTVQKISSVKDTLYEYQRLSDILKRLAAEKLATNDSLENIFNKFFLKICYTRGKI